MALKTTQITEPTLRPASPSAATQRIGRWHGDGVALVSRAGVHASHQASRAAAARIGHEKPLSERKVRGEKRLTPLPTPDLAQYLRVMHQSRPAEAAAARRMGAQILRTRQWPSVAGNHRASRQLYAALRAAKAYISSDEDSEDDAVALITPLRADPQPSNAQEFADLLQQASDENDARALAEMLADVPGLEKDPKKLMERLQEGHLVRERPPTRLMRFLRDAQGLPADKKALERDLGDRLNDALLELENDRRILASLSFAPIADEVKTLGDLPDAFDDFIHASTTVALRLRHLLERFGPEKLLLAVEAITRGLGRELDAERGSASDRESLSRLHMTMTGLSDMHSLNMVLEMVNGLADQLTRTKHRERLQAAAAA